jgi:hypothetical protein
MLARRGPELVAKSGLFPEAARFHLNAEGSLPEARSIIKNLTKALFLYSSICRLAAQVRKVFPLGGI